MKPCLAENWFVEDSMEDGTADHPLLHIFHPTDKELALREVYRMSCDLRAKRVLMGKIKEARETSNKAALEVMEILAVLSDMASTNFVNREVEDEQR